MNDDVLKILLSESDVNLIMNALTFLASEFDNDGDGFTGALELHDDLLEQIARQDDPDWVTDTEPTEIEEGRTFSVAESDFIDHGIRAREMQKATSRAADRRAMRFGEFTVGDKEPRTEIKTVDVWDDSDPTNW